MHKNTTAALCATSLSFCTLYAPQPILPVLAAEFGVGAAGSSLLVTMTLAPLGLAPVVYGYFLQAIPARSMLRVAVLLLLIDQFAFLFADAFWQLLALRFLQGLLLPAIFTALMTYCAGMGAHSVRRAMGFYIGATILGGFGGRAIGGFFADYFAWQMVFAALGVLLLPALAAVCMLDADSETGFHRLDRRSIGRVLATPLCRRSYAILFAVFMAFTGVLNLLPFRALDAAPGLSPFWVSLMYTGYLAGIPLAAFSEQLIRAFGGARRALFAALLVTFGGLFLYAPAAPALLFLGMPVFAGGMFFLHASLSGMLNDRAREHKGVINGLYVSVYYISGALGSWLPGYLYESAGWGAVIFAAAGLLGVAAYFAAKIRA